MRHEYVNEQMMPIDPVERSTLLSEIVVDDLGDATVADAEVRVDIDHTWTGDLVLRLIGPDGTRVVLVDRAGGSRNDFRGTVFRSDAQNPIRDGRPPFRGVFRPEGDLRTLFGKPAVGAWRLEIEDRAAFDGGALNRWSIGLDTDTAPASPFHIDLRILGGLSPTQQRAFGAAAARWAEIIVGDLTPVLVDGEEIDDVLILAEGTLIDGPGQILGQAGPTHLRPGSMLPAKGIMSFDSADLDQMEANGRLADVIAHEMAHVLGFGTLWSRMRLIADAGTANPSFTGTNAMREYAALSGRDTPTRVPVANTGGPGTRDGHWRESVFGDELLTGFISGGTRPISRTSIGAFEDMGYQVDYSVADEYSLPTLLALAEMGVLEARHTDPYVILRTEPQVIPPTAMLNR